MFDQKIIKTIIEEAKLVKEADLQKFAEAAEAKKMHLDEYLVHENILDEDKIYQAVADYFKVPFYNLRGSEIKKEILEMIPSALAVSRQAIAFSKEENILKVAMLDPLDLQTIEFIERKNNLKVQPHLTTPSILKEFLKRYHHSLETDLKLTFTKGGAQGQTEKDLKKIAEDLPIINIVNSILEHSVFEGASDIHIEPLEKEVTVRYRIDGILKPIMTLPKAVQSGITARIKILANLKLDEHMQPQDGRITLNIQDEKLSLRVSILPVYDGEKIVMRLLREDMKPLTLDQLGFLDADRAKLDKNILSPQGMILVTGPTGSGKTTTLYSILNILNKPDVNISTIEDPIEYHISGVNQSQVNPRIGYTFANGLRSFLRQDPNIIMVGEIRDIETAEVAVNAAMTGHLVLSTLHTNDAPTTVPRLLDMGIPAFLVAFTTNIIIAQRLVRRVCQYCKEPFKLTEANIADLEKMVDTKRMVDLFKDNKCLEEGEQKMKEWTFYRGAGCRRCNNEGYKGRIGIYEILDVTKKMSELINRKATVEEIRQAAIADGFTNMLESGLVKAKQGATTIEEVLSATKV